MKYPSRRQYKHAKVPYRVRNWSEHEAGLRRRGDITVWFSDDAIQAWRAQPSGRPGGQRLLSNPTFLQNVRTRHFYLSPTARNCDTHAYELREISCHDGNRNPSGAYGPILRLVWRSLLTLDLLDNEPWDKGRAVLEGWELPVTDAYYSARHFSFFVPASVDSSAKRAVVLAIPT